MIRADQVGTPPAPYFRLQELNQEKVHHLLDYLDRAAITALEVADVANTASTLSPAVETVFPQEYTSFQDSTTLRGGHTSPVGDEKEVVFSTIENPVLPPVQRTQKYYDTSPSVEAARMTHERLNGSSSESTPARTIMGDEGGRAAAATAVAAPSSSTTTDGHRGLPYHAASSICVPMVRSIDSSSNPAFSMDQMSNASTSLPLSSSSLGTVPFTAPHPQRDRKIMEGTRGIRALQEDVTSKKSVPHRSSSNLQHIFLELQEKMDRLRYDGKMLQHEKEVLLEELEKAREREKETRRRTAKEAEAEVSRTKEKLLKTISAQEKQVESLEVEKKGLEKNLEQLSREIREMKMHQDEERHRIEAAHATALSLLQSKFTTKERAAREKWREQEAKKIKASTLQSLEPDIVMLLQRQKAEKARLEEEWTAVIREKDKKSKEAEEGWERKVMLMQHDFQEKLSSMRLEQEREESRRQEEMEARLKRERGQCLSQMERTTGMEKEELRNELEREFRLEKEKERRRYEEDVRRWKDEAQRLRSQYNQELILATQAAHQEEESKRLKWQEEFARHTEEEVRLRCSRDFQQQVREMEVSLQQRYTKERDDAVEKVLSSLQHEHESEQEKYRRERQQETKQLQHLQRDVETMREEKESYRQQLLVTTAERERLTLQYQEMCEANRGYQVKEKMYMEKLEAKGKLEQDVLHSELERQKQELLTKYSNEKYLLESQYKERERLQQQELQGHIEEKRSLIQQHHEELRQIQGRVMDTVKAKETAVCDLQQRVHYLEQELKNQESWAGKQKELLLHR